MWHLFSYILRFLTLGHKGSGFLKYFVKAPQIKIPSRGPVSALKFSGPGPQDWGVSGAPGEAIQKGVSGTEGAIGAGIFDQGTNRSYWGLGGEGLQDLNLRIRGPGLIRQ